MKSETMAVEHFPLSTNQTYDEEQVDLTERDLCERPHSIKENANNHQSISYFNKAMPESTLTDDEIFRSKLPESRTSALKIKTVYCHTEEGGVGEEHPRISLGNRLGGLQNPLQVLSPDYADPKRVPGTDQNIYPRAPIGPEFHERYPQIVDFFKQAVDNHKFLKYHTSNINYELRLCGSAPSNAVASVVIFCTAAIFKHLRSLLKSKHIQRQYQPKKPFTVNRFQFATNKSHLQISAPVIAPFKVVFWRETLTPTERKSAMEQVVAKSNSFLTMCGSLVRYGDRTSTLGLLISVDSKLYGLTVDHLFKSHRDENQPTVVDERFILPDEDDTEEDHQENWPWVDDVTYENMDNDGWGSDDESVSSGRSHAEMTMDHGLTENCRASRNGHKVDSVAERAPSTPYLDWALIEFDNGYFERPNAWNVILSDSESVIDGDCGSLVVDQETLEVYGHVVASNPLGEAYVIPLHNTFYQIRDALGVLDLALPNPGLLMENLATYYSNAGNAGVAEQANLILASMEGTSSTGNQHDVEDQVYKDPATFLGLDLKATEEPRRSEPFSILIRRLPLDITEERLTLMVIWSKELMEAEVLLPEKSEDPGFRSAVLLFKSHAGASEAKSVLDGHTENDVRIIVDILHGTSISSRRRIINNTSTTGLSLTASSVSSTAPAPTLHSKFNLPSLQKVSPTNAGVYPTLDPPQSPSGNHLNRPSRVTSKSSSNTDIIDDNGTGKLMTPSAHKFFSFGARRLSSPQIVNSCITTSPSNTNAMSLSTSSVAAISDAPVSDAYIMSRTLTEGKGPVNCQPGSQYLERHKSSHVNPADQNPPCNTLYVGNLPIDTSEDELKAMFSKQRGYKRMCFRTKQSGPMCFVEFEDISLATKALHELYGHPLQNSIMGGIRLSFSKNSLGVRSGPDTMATDSLNALVPPSNTSAPPPRLSTSPGIAPEIICHSAAMSPVTWRK